MTAPATLLFVILCARAGNALYVNVDTQEETCFYDRVENLPSRIVFSFEVVDGGFLDISASIHNPTGDVIWEEAKLSNTVQNFEAPGVGKYSFCFHNTVSTLTPKVVKFELAVFDTATQNATKLQESIAELGMGLRQIKMEQSYMSVREKLHLELKEYINRQVAVFCMLEALFMALICTMQIMYLRRFFSIVRIV